MTHFFPLIIFAALIFLGLPSVLAFPLIVRAQGRFFRSFILSLMGVVVPLFFFLISTFLAPDSKTSCRHGWVDCWIIGKLALTPLALWATAALYAFEIIRVKNRLAGWLVLGIFQGAIISIVCLVYGLFIYTDGIFELFLLVPLYVSGWYSWRAYQLIKAAPLDILHHVSALISCAPFWLASWWWSRTNYQSLPETGCFVVTAASRGHDLFVGPFTETIHHGNKRRANQQLTTFWQFEALWRHHSPDSHACFRRIYNRVGPIIARNITSPWLADATCAGLKPLEWTARLILKFQSINQK